MQGQEVAINPNDMRNMNSTEAMPASAVELLRDALQRLYLIRNALDAFESGVDGPVPCDSRVQEEPPISLMGCAQVLPGDIQEIANRIQTLRDQVTG